MSTSLALLLPLLVLAVVLLFAFAGCFTKPDRPERRYPDFIRETAGLVAYWRLGDGTLPDALDSGPLHLTGTYNGGVALLAEPGAVEQSEAGDKAPAFNGQDAYVEVPWDVRLNPPSFSVEAWIRPAGFTAGWSVEQQIVASHNIVGGLDYGFEITVVRQPDPNPRIQGRVCTGVATPAHAYEVVFAIPDAQLGGPGNDWKHVVLTYDGLAADTPATLYVDGVAQASQTNVLYTPNSGQPLRIAAGRTPQDPAPAELYAGAIDEVAVYNVALTQAVVAAHFQLSGR